MDHRKITYEHRIYVWMDNINPSEFTIQKSTENSNHTIKDQSLFKTLTQTEDTIVPTKF